jgi:predicted TIM-barrel fold metal-dependent hydrolase
VKLHPVVGHFSLLDRRLDPILKAAGDAQVPVMVHTGWRPTGSVLNVGRLAERYPAIRFVVAHMKEEWGVNRRLSHIAVAEAHPNIWLECSYAEHPRRVAEAVARLGAGRILFGSDWPLGGGRINWDMTKVTFAAITEEEKVQILGENARRLLGL